MNIIKKITFLSALIISFNQSIHIQALPNGGGLANRINRGNEAHNAGGFAMHKNNNQSNNINNPATVASTIQQSNQTQSAPLTEDIKPQNQAITPSIENDQNNETSTVQAETTNQEPNTPAQTSNDSFADANIPTQISTSSTPDQYPTTQEPKSADNQNKETKSEADTQATIVDQDTILKTLQDINNQDSQNHMLLTENAMSQLFNNFVYFKNFIVENFTKEKMIRFCIEFIDQIYPKETVIAHHTIQQTSQNSENTSIEQNQFENINRSQQEEPSTDNMQNDDMQQNNNVKNETQDYVQELQNQTQYNFNSQNINEETTDEQTQEEEMN